MMLYWEFVATFLAPRARNIMICGEYMCLYFDDKCFFTGHGDIPEVTSTEVSLFSYPASGDCGKISAQPHI